MNKIITFLSLILLGCKSAERHCEIGNSETFQVFDSIVIKPVPSLMLVNINNEHINFDYEGNLIGAVVFSAKDSTNTGQITFRKSEIRKRDLIMLSESFVSSQLAEIGGEASEVLRQIDSANGKIVIKTLISGHIHSYKASIIDVYELRNKRLIHLSLVLNDRIFPDLRVFTKCLFSEINLVRKGDLRNALE
ncbi:MAG: hypothetical protein ABWZ25_13615 [Chitinophagaceae bacterium]